LDTILRILDKELNASTEKIEVLKVLLESSIITNEMDETYEVAAVLRDIKKLLDEQND
jgi:protein-arginine kinase activator protein McsA